MSRSPLPPHLRVLRGPQAGVRSEPVSEPRSSVRDSSGGGRTEGQGALVEGSPGDGLRSPAPGPAREHFPGGNVST